MAIERVILLEADLSMQGVPKNIQLFARSSDALEINVTSDGTTGVDMTGWTPGVRIYTGTDSRSPQVIFRRPEGDGTKPPTCSAPPDTTGVYLLNPQTIKVEMQPDDLFAGDLWVTCEVWITEDGTIPPHRIMIALYRIAVVSTAENNAI